MNKKTVGMLTGAAVGAVAFRLAQQSEPVSIKIVVESDGDVIRLSSKPADVVYLRFGQQILWLVTNKTNAPIRLAVENWRRPQRCQTPQPEHDRTNAPRARRTLPPAYADAGPGLWTVVDPGLEAVISAVGRLAKFVIIPEECEYDVFVNDKIVADPIVKLVL